MSDILDQAFSPVLDQAGSPLYDQAGAPVTPVPLVPIIVSTGKWYSLAAIYEDQRYEFETWQQITETEGGLSCPVCGEPLLPGGDRNAIAYCRFAGDHKFHVPRDVVRPERGSRMGRYG